MGKKSINNEEGKELQREQLDEIWDTLDADSIKIFEKNFDKEARRLLEFLVVSLILEETLGVIDYRKDDKRWKRIEYDFYNNADKSLALLFDGKIFVLELFIYDYDSEGNNNRYFYYTLNEDDLQFIPEGILIRFTGIKTKTKK